MAAVKHSSAVVIGVWHMPLSILTHATGGSGGGRGARPGGKMGGDGGSGGGDGGGDGGKAMLTIENLTLPPGGLRPSVRSPNAVFESSVMSAVWPRPSSPDTSSSQPWSISACPAWSENSMQCPPPPHDGEFESSTVAVRPFSEPA